MDVTSGAGPDSTSGHLLHNLILFGRLLRGLGLDVNPDRTIDLARALGQVDAARREDFYHAARCLLVRRREDLPLFDRAFDLFWRSPFAQPAQAGPRLPGPSARPGPSRLPRLREVGGLPRAGDTRPPTSNEQSPGAQTILTYSDREALRHKDVAQMTAEELEAVRRMMAELTWSLGRRRTRRMRAGDGPRLDLRRTLRRGLRHGGEILEWARRELKFKPRPLVVLADISGSMERYTRLLLHFIYGLSRGFDPRVEAFVFSTRLTRITRQLQTRDAERALRDVSRRVPDWSGGTRIGEALKEFNFVWGRRVLGRGAAVLLISDGWDRGRPDLLRAEMARLHRSCHRLIWLNPLLGSPQYEPLTRGMQAALPYTDDFLPVHNLASLEDLGRRLEALDERSARVPPGRFGRPWGRVHVP